MHARKTEIMRGLIEDGRVQARPGAHRLLDELDASGIPVHVATTGTRAWVEPLLDRVFGRRFHTLITGTEVPDLKPSPAVYQEVLRRTSCPVDRTVAVEDSQNGVKQPSRPVCAAWRPTTRTPGRDDLSGTALVADGLNDPALVAWFHRRIPRRPKG
jgi:HAD superfamily hydrolase (TIGR01509 family)